MMIRFERLFVANSRLQDQTRRSYVIGIGLLWYSRTIWAYIHYMYYTRNLS